jgi:hypothetical protein
VFEEVVAMANQVYPENWGNKTGNLKLLSLCYGWAGRQGCDRQREVDAERRYCPSPLKTWCCIQKLCIICRGTAMLHRLWSQRSRQTGPVEVCIGKDNRRVRRVFLPFSRGILPGG